VKGSVLRLFGGRLLGGTLLALATILLPCLFGGPASAQAPKHRAVYRDAAYGTNWVSAGAADAIASYFTAAGYELLDASTIRAWLDARIKDRERAVLINSHDVLPDTALDPAGAALAPSPNNPIRRFLLAGGRLVQVGDIPFYLHAPGATASNAGWADNGARIILGRTACNGTRDLSDIPTITAAGAAWGLTQDVVSVRPNKVDQVDIVLSENSVGEASAWVQKLINVPGRGEFVRLADHGLGTGDITPELLDDIKRVAEYTPTGTPTGPLDTGVTGTVTLDGAPLVGSEVLIRDESGRIAARAATDAQGAFFAYLLPGKYTVDPNVDPTYGAAVANVTLDAGKVVALPEFQMARFPSISLIKENGFQWLANISPDLRGDEDFSAPNAAEADFVPWNVTANNGNFTPDLLDARGIPNGDMHVWLRLHITLPPEWGARYRGPLRLYGFNFNASDETFFNGKSIGKTGVNPPGPDRTGFTRDADTIRNYLVPADLVNWDGDNVIAIHGYHDGGTGGFTSARPKLAATVVSSSTGPTITTGLQGTLTLDGKPAEAITVRVTDAQGAVAAIATTDKDGKFAASLAPGTYKVEPQLTIDYAATSANATVEAGKVTTLPPFNVVKLPSVALIKENGYQWLAYISPDLMGDEDFSAPNASEASFEPWNVTAGNGNFTPDLLDAKGIPNGDMHVWLRLHLTIPSGWGHGDLRLYGFNFNASDETFFNGKSIGKTGVNPPGPDRTGFTRDADTIRNYRIPADLVNWTGDNVIAIHGYHDGGTGGFTAARPMLGATVSAVPAVVKGDLNGDGKVAIADTTIALKIAVGLVTASPAQLAAGDLNGDGKIAINEVTQILRAAVGLVTL